MKYRKIVDYDMISEETPPKICNNIEANGWLTLSVKKSINNGFEPFGVPMFLKNHNGYTGLAQAMVKYEDSEQCQK